MTKEDVALLAVRLDELMGVIKKGTEEIPYFYHFFDYMRNNIDIYNYTQDDDMEFLECVLRRDWDAANDKLLGIPANPLFETGPECEKTREVWLYYLELLTSIGTFF